MLCEIVRFAVPGCALAAAIWMLARYFAVLRPRAGTTEWIGRLTPPPWQPVSGCQFSNCVWGFYLEKNG